MKTEIKKKITLEDEMKKIEQLLNTLNNPNKRNNYPNNLTIATSIKNHLQSLNFFYNTLVEKQNPTSPDPSNTFYNIKSRPKEGEIAYFNLGTGYPKEIHNGHYCYIFKDYKTKFLIIPTTSVKSDTEPNEDFEFDIQINSLKKDTGTKSALNTKQKSRLQLSDMRTIDIQRINLERGVYTVSTPLNDINDFLEKKLFNNC